MADQFYRKHWIKVLQLQNFLTKHQYFSKDALPGIADALMIQIFNKQFPDKKKYPALYFWYINIKQFSSDAINSWTIKSDMDHYFLDLLVRYQKLYEKNIDTASVSRSNKTDEKQNQNFAIPSIGIYCINIRFRYLNKKEIDTLQKHIQRKAEILSYECIGSSIMNICIKCDSINLQLIKGEIEQSKLIINYQISKKRVSKILRAQTLKSH